MSVGTKNLMDVLAPFEEGNAMGKKLEDLEAKQTEERANYLGAILQSTSRRKIIIAGPGTGKTFTFGKILDLKSSRANIALTFIRRLAADMDGSLGAHAEVKTFHAYCKKILHEQNGRVNLVPFLSRLIQNDSDVLGQNLSGFDRKFQMLEEGSRELSFYLARGDYYDAVAFNDSVYRLYKQLQRNGDVLPDFDQILIDEFQDFNALEVAFIGEL